MTEKLLLELNHSMEILIALTAISALQGRNQREQIEVLDRAGLPPKDIAKLVGTSPNVVSVTLSQMKRATKTPKLKSKGK